MKFLSNQKGVAQILVLIVLLLGISAGVYLVQHPQIFKSRAFFDSCDPSTEICVEKSEVQSKTSPALSDLSKVAKTIYLKETFTYSNYLRFSYDGVALVEVKTLPDDNNTTNFYASFLEPIFGNIVPVNNNSVKLLTGLSVSAKDKISAGKYTGYFQFINNSSGAELLKIPYEFTVIDGASGSLDCPIEHPLDYDTTTLKQLCSVQQMSTMKLNYLYKFDNQTLIEIANSTGNLREFLAQFSSERLLGIYPYEGSGFDFSILRQLPDYRIKQFSKDIQDQIYTR